MTQLKATMAGTIFEVHVAAGDEVTAGQVVIILESMKMEIPIEAETAGKKALDVTQRFSEKLRTFFKRRPLFKKASAFFLFP